MKKICKLTFLLLVTALIMTFVACSNPSGGSGSNSSTQSGSDSGSGSGTGGQQGGSGEGQQSGGSSSGSGEGQQGNGGSNNSTPYTVVDTQIIGTTTYDIVEFGSFPQSKKIDSVTISTKNADCIYRASRRLYKGSDGAWYCKNGSDGYYKYEPIRWRVLTTDYDHDNNPSTPGKKLLLAEKCLYTSDFNSNYDNNNWADSELRSGLNGNFLSFAFTSSEQEKIIPTYVVNNSRSTYQDNITSYGVNPNASDTITTDKVFLLSVQEATKYDYGFEVSTNNDSIRIREKTDYCNSTDGYWWLRSPSSDTNYACIYQVQREGKVICRL